VVVPTFGHVDSGAAVSAPEQFTLVRYRPAPSLPRRWVLGLSVAATVLAVDLETKHLAAVYLPGNPKSIGAGFSIQAQLDPGNFMSPHAASGAVVILSHLVLLTTVASIVSLLGSRRAALASGLLLGGFFGNWVSLSLRPHEVVDILSWGHSSVYNISDFSILTGAVLLASDATITAVRLWRRHTSARILAPPTT
jgi:signal peptidase II